MSTNSFKAPDSVHRVRAGGLSLIVAETPDGKKQDIFVADYHFHIWNAAKDNWLRPDLAKGWINCFYDYTKALSPPEYVWDWDTYAYYGEEKALHDVFLDGGVDMAIFEPQTLMYFYHKGFSNVDAIRGYVTKWPDRLVMGSRWDPRDGEKGKAPPSGTREQAPTPPAHHRSR